MDNVPWALKRWPDFTESDKAGLEHHLLTMETGLVVGYIKYLHHFCGAPPLSEWAEIIKERAKNDRR